MWVTFFGDHLWWCFSERRIEKLPDDTKIRHVLGKWLRTDINDEPLSFNHLSGKDAEGAKVNAKIEIHGRGEKLLVFKFKRKKQYRKTQGHRRALPR